MGTIYLLHFDRPIGDTTKATGYAQHYTGYTDNLIKRLEDHRNGNGDSSKIMIAVAKAGIDWQLARTWTGDRKRERQIKRTGSAKRYCPICGIKPKKY